jgi:hypothetical protein
MAIVRHFPDIDPAELQPGQMVLVDTDAPSNAKAILEIVQFCHEHGLWRADEPNLSTVFFEGRWLQRGRCYRPYPEEQQQRMEAWVEIDRRREQMPLTTSSVELTRGQ